MNSHLLQGTVRLLQSQAEEAATVRDAAVAACSAATEQAEAAAADTAALLRTLRQQLDDARCLAAADAQRIAELSDKLQVDASPPGSHLGGHLGDISLRCTRSARGCRTSHH